METQFENRPKLLTVDDEVNILKSLKRTLRRCEIDVTIANSGKEALEIMANVEFDVIISDMRMPEMSGAEFLAMAGTLQPDSKRILLTGYSDIESTIDAINKGGVSTYLAKPWDDDQLIRVVNDAVKVSRLVRENANLQVITQRQNDELFALNAGLEEKVAARTAEIASASAKLEQAMKDLTGSYDTMITLLANTAALRDKEGSAKNDEKVQLAITMANIAGLKPPDIRIVGQAMQLHRIGRLSLPDYLLSKPFLSLNESEREKLQQHPLLAEATLMGVAELNAAALLIRHQNERWDGRGFPDRKLHETTPIGARIITIARDYYDLIAGLYDTRKYSKTEALKFIGEATGKAYDPGLLEVLDLAIEKLGSASETEDILVLDVARLEPGMRLAADLKSAEGMMLLGKDQELTDTLIRKISTIARSAGSKMTVKVWRN